MQGWEGFVGAGLMDRGGGALGFGFLEGGGEFDAGGDVVDVLSNVVWEVIS